jgi:hypothetical protein
MSTSSEEMGDLLVSSFRHQRNELRIVGGRGESSGFLDAPLSLLGSAESPKPLVPKGAASPGGRL